MWKFDVIKYFVDFMIINRNFRQKSKFLAKIEIFDKNRNFRKKSKFSAKNEIVGKK